MTTVSAAPSSALRLPLWAPASLSPYTTLSSPPPHHIRGFAGVSDKRVGDAVFGIAPGCLGASVIVPSDLMVALPPHLSFEAGATAPTVYCTVYAAFSADLQAMAGKKVGVPSYSSAACLND